MSNKRMLVDLSTLDLTNVYADQNEIRRHNAQRFEMEQLSAIVHVDLSQKLCVGYKDVTDQEFWVRGHMPGMPLMPGVVMLEAAAQLSSYFAHRFSLLGEQDIMLGFGGLEDVRFRDPVVPGDRLYLICQMERVRPGRMVICRFQGVVRENIVVDGLLKGVPIPVDFLKGGGPPPSQDGD